RAFDVGRDLAGQPRGARAAFSGGAVAPRRRRDSRTPARHRQVASLVRPVGASEAPQPRKEYVMPTHTDDTLRKHQDPVDRMARKFKWTTAFAGVVAVFTY